MVSSVPLISQPPAPEPSVDAHARVEIISVPTNFVRIVFVYLFTYCWYLLIPRCAYNAILLVYFVGIRTHCCVSSISHDSYTAANVMLILSTTYELEKVPCAQMFVIIISLSFLRAGRILFSDIAILQMKKVTS